MTIPDLDRDSGGTSAVVAHLSEALSLQGVDIEVVTQTTGLSKRRAMLPDPDLVPTHVSRAHALLKERIVISRDYARVLRSRIEQSRPDILHDNGIWLHSNHISASTSEAREIPLIITPHGMLEPWALSYRGWKKRMAWCAYQRRDLERAALLVAASRQEASSFRRAGLRQPIAVVPNGVVLPSRAERKPRGETIRQALFLSRLHPVKGLLNLVAAWALARPRGWRMTIAGPGLEGYRHDVERAIHNEGLQHDFVLTGPVYGEAKDRLYRAADLFILPTFSENFGVAVAEALSYGLPVITTKGAPWHDLRAHECGWWVDIGVEPLAEAIREATRLSEAERIEMGDRGRRLVETKYSWESVAAKMITAYRWIIGGGNPPPGVIVSPDHAQTCPSGAETGGSDV